MKKLTSAQERLLKEFQEGAKIRQGNLKMTRADGSAVRYQIRSMLPLIAQKLIWVDPQDSSLDWSINA